MNSKQIDETLKKLNGGRLLDVTDRHEVVRLINKQPEYVKSDTMRTLLEMAPQSTGGGWFKIYWLVLDSTPQDMAKALAYVIEYPSFKYPFEP